VVAQQRRALSCIEKTVIDGFERAGEFALDRVSKVGSVASFEVMPPARVKEKEQDPIFYRAGLHVDGGEACSCLIEDCDRVNRNFW